MGGDGWRVLVVVVVVVVVVHGSLMDGWMDGWEGRGVGCVLCDDDDDNDERYGRPSRTRTGRDQRALGIYLPTCQVTYDDYLLYLPTVLRVALLLSSGKSSALHQFPTTLSLLTLTLTLTLTFTLTLTLTFTFTLTLAAHLAFRVSVNYDVVGFARLPFSQAKPVCTLGRPAS
ncbi:hypothetical protein LZ31DRAFT_542038 [Colletotrichum somersetense]|nr:hypothetical protein LZ31DRAFT_542038 [Colletotrichum somersetense]